MASIGRKLKTKGVIMALLTPVLMNIGCEDKIDNPAVRPSEGKTVEVTLDLGFADEADGYTLSAPSTTKSNAAVFNYALQPAVTTKGAESSMKPDKLYNLEIQQYGRSGNHIGGMNTSDVTDHEIGSALSLSLEADPDCQLVIVAWGDGNTATRLGTTDNLATVQSKRSVDASTISSLQPGNQTDMNKMPYVLHLEHVCVESNTIKSVVGEDVRLLLRRLATRLTFDWSYSYAGYALKQILLQSIPTNYNVVAAPDNTDKTYPSLLDQFTTIQLTPTEIGVGKYSCWIPANVRGTNPAATSQTYRIKSNAPKGSSYVDFIASNTTEAKKKLSYRVYLGGSGFSDFNLYSNTNYNYTVRINHSGLPVNDRRVTIIDPIPASQNNDNLVPTANCFMVAPGGAFCFDPYTYLQKGVSITNGTLDGWTTSEGGIASVKLLWQTKEDGDLGDPVMGVVTAADDHTNIVDIKRIDGNSLPATAKGQARIYCRVAPNTTGGSGAIAAYNESGNILWSWHIWVTDYNPDPTGDEDVQTPVNKRKQKFEYGSSSFLPMMDRNLGAMAGYIDFPPDELEKSKTNGFYYQWGRKDPFIGSYSNTRIDKIPYTEIKKDAPTKGLLSLFEADGITFHPTGYVQKLASYRDVYKDPANMYKSSNSSWISSQTDEYRNSWGAGSTKGIHDPCPAGWRVANGNNYNPVTTNGSTPRLKTGTGVKDGGFVVYYDKQGINTTYFYLAGYWELQGMISINSSMHFWGGDALDGSSKGKYIYASPSAAWRFTGGNTRESLLLRCSQELK